MDLRGQPSLLHVLIKITLVMLSTALRILIQDLVLYNYDNKLTFIEHLICARLHAKFFVCLISFPAKSPKRSIH